MEASRRSKQQTKAEGNGRNTQAAEASLRMCAHPREALHGEARPATPSP